MGLSTRQRVSLIVVASIIGTPFCLAGIGMSDTRGDLDRSIDLNTMIGGSINLAGEDDATRQGSRSITDPGFRYGTLIGGTQSGDDVLYEVGIDAAGNVYAGGRTESNHLPVTTGAFDDTLNGSYDVFLVKFDPTMSNLLYCTYLGGDDYENVGGIHVYPDGRVLILGTSESADFPTTLGAFCETLEGNQSAFLAIMNPQGTDLTYSTFVGGSGDDSGTSLALDPQGRVHIVGGTKSDDLPVTTGANKTFLSGPCDAYAMRFSADLSTLEYSTYLGGNEWDSGGDAVLRSDGSLVIKGYTDGQFPTTSGAYANTFHNDGQFVLELDPTGSTIAYASLCPDTPLWEMYTDLEVHSNGDIIISGITNSSTFPTTPDALRDTIDGESESFIAILSNNASELSFSTFLGGNASDYIQAIDLDPSGDLLVMAGASSSWDLPVTPGAFDIQRRDAYDYTDAFLCVLNLTDKSLDYMTYIGGDLDDDCEDVWVAPNGHVFVVGSTRSRDFYTSPHAFQTERLSAEEGFIYEIDPIPGHIPGAPKGLKDSTTTDQVFLNWDKPDKDGGCRILNYNVYRADASSDWTLLQNHTNRTFDDWDVNNGVRYRYRVAAVNHLGEGAFAELTTTVPVIPPSEPLDLKASTDNGSVTLNWTPPIDLGGGRIEAYVVYRGPTRNELEVLETIGNLTSFLDDTAILGEFVYYAVTGRNSGGLGIQSAAVRIKPVGPPGAPGGFSAVGEDAKVTLTWTAPGSDGGSMLIGFYVYRGTTLDNVGVVATKTVVQLSHVDTSVVNGVQYVYYLTAFTDVAESRPSNAIDVTPFGLPGRAQDLEATADDGQVSLDWSPPETDGGRAITKYKVYAGEGSAGAMTYLTQIGNVTTFSHTGLTNGITYFYQVTAVNAAGEGQVSVTVSATPMALPGPVTEFAAEAVKGGIRLTWKIPEDLGGAESVKVWIYETDPDAPQFEDFMIGATSFLDTNVTPGVTYRYWAKTETSFGWGPTVGPVTVTAVSAPGQVRNLLTSYGDGEVHLTWSAPEDDGGSEVVEYIVRRGIFVTGMVEIARVTTLSYDDTGLVNGKEYLYLVVAVNSVGGGAETDPVEGKPLGLPAVPGLFKAEAKGKKVVLSWAKPSGSDRAPVTGYRILRMLGEGQFEMIAEVGDITTYTDQDVKEGKSYTYRVVGLSDIGDGEATPGAEVKIKKADEGPGFTGSMIIIALCYLAPEFVKWL